MSIPNLISIFRILLIPLFIYAFVQGSSESRILYPVIIFVISGISDVLDGYIARTYHMETKLGAVLDPLADKLMLLTALICFAYYHYIPYWIVIIVGIKELMMIGGGFLAYRQDIINRANAWGKIATFLFHISIVTFLVSNVLATIFLSVSVIVSLAALVQYIKITLEKKRKIDQSRS